MFQILVSNPRSLPYWFKNLVLFDPDLLLQLCEDAKAGRRPLLELADQFSLVLHDLRMGGTWKRTNRRRLRRTEDMLCTHVSPSFHANCVLLDIGASDGVTTVELARSLRAAFGHQVTCYVADLNLNLYRYRRGILVEYRARDGEPIVMRLGCFGLRLSRHRLGLKERPLSFFARQYLRCDRLRSSLLLDRTISLVNPLCAFDAAVHAIELDCFTCNDNLLDRFSAVRASNVLNLSYFTPNQISVGIAHLHRYLRPGGCLVVSRNMDQNGTETENGSVWIKVGREFRWIEDFGSGSEIKDIVHGWRAAES